VSTSNPVRKEQTNSADEFPSDLFVDLHAEDGGVRERLEAAIRRAIQNERLRPGTPLPPSRVLAEDLQISRSVVVEAYECLAADGYLESRTGAGTWVRRPSTQGSDRVRDRPLARGPTAAPRFQPPRRPSVAAGPGRIRFFGGLPDPALFPRARWLRHYRAALNDVPDPELTYPDMLGAPALRTALAAYLGRVRGVVAAPHQILICSGFTQGLVLLCRVLRRQGATRFAVEDPCFAHHRAAIERTGLQAVPVAVRGSGIDPSALPDDVDGVLVAPAHSYPTGGTLESTQRHALITWARRTGALVVEDDYDAEFRYDRKPIGALQGLAPEHVAYVGCASKTVSPALRLGWAAVPGQLIDSLEQEKLYDDMGSTLLDQLAFARFVDSGDFARHLRRVRPLYRARRDATLDALAKRLPDARAQGEAAGLHVHVLLPADVDELEFAAAAYERGVLVEDGAWHWAKPEQAPPSIVLGYGSVNESQIRRGVAMLAAALVAAR
jgi:GntR family transcriptional regulator / MocR family aminotransferase